MSRRLRAKRSQPPPRGRRGRGPRRQTEGEDENNETHKATDEGNNTHKTRKNIKTNAKRKRKQTRQRRRQRNTQGERRRQQNRQGERGRQRNAPSRRRSKQRNPLSAFPLHVSGRQRRERSERRERGLVGFQRCPPDGNTTFGTLHPSRGNWV